MMEIEQHIQVLHAQLLEMSKLSQRAVDYSIKAYELGCPEFCRHVRYTDHELRDIHFCLADRCRKLLMAGLPADSDSRFVWSAFRICSTLQATYIAAAEIAQNTMLFLESGQVQESMALKEMGQTVNRLVRLCSVALLKEEVQHAKIVLRNEGVRRWFELIAYHVRSDIGQGIGAQATFELAIAKSLGEIAKQAHEMADAITVWLERKVCIDVTRQRVAYVLRESLPMREDEEETKSYFPSPDTSAQVKASDY
jgi:phosphate uptake regulator